MKIRARTFPSHTAGMLYACKQLLRFGWQQALSCLFPVVIFAALALTRFVDLPADAGLDGMAEA